MTEILRLFDLGNMPYVAFTQGRATQVVIPVWQKINGKWEKITICVPYSIRIWEN